MRSNFKGITLAPELYDDYVSAGFEGLVLASNNYDSGKGVKFSTFATKCILNSIIGFNKAFQTKKAVAKVSAIDPVVFASIYAESSQCPVEAKEEAESDNIAELIRCLSKAESHLIRSLLKGERQVDYSARMKVSRSRVSYMYMIAVKKMRTYAKKLQYRRWDGNNA